MVKPEIDLAPVAPSDPAGPESGRWHRAGQEAAGISPVLTVSSAIAAISVLLLHTAWASGFTLRSSLGIYASRLEIGVSIFFLISGFLLYRPFVASHLSGRASPNTRRFWERRLLRIVPALLAGPHCADICVPQRVAGPRVARGGHSLPVPPDLLSDPGGPRHSPGLVTVHGNVLLSLSTRSMRRSWPLDGPHREGNWPAK